LSINISKYSSFNIFPSAQNGKKDKSLAKQTTIFFGEFVLNTIDE